jgi:hypothetical protein
VTLPLVPPPVKSVPAVTPVIVPLPPIVAQAQAVPLHWRTCFDEHVFNRLSVRLPVEPPPLSPLPVAVVTPVIVPVPVPGKVWPLANVNSPLLLSFNPVSVGEAVPEPNSRFSVPDGVVVLLLAASACHWKVWLTAALVLLLNDEAMRS